MELGTACRELEQWRSAAARYQLDVETLQQAFTQHALLRERTDRLQGERSEIDEYSLGLGLVTSYFGGKLGNAEQL